jgi:hypothetical protein
MMPTQCLATDLPALVAHFVPGSVVHFVRAVTQLSCKGNNLCDDQLGNTAGVAEGRVEDRNTVVGGILEVDLVGTDAEAADNDQVLGLLQNPLRELGLRADTDDMNITALLEAVVRNGLPIGMGDLTNRIFSMSWSSGREDLRNSTW